MKCGKKGTIQILGKFYEKETIASHWNMGFTIIKCLTFAIISMRVINVTVTTITSGHPRPGRVTRQPWSHTGPGLWRNCEYSACVWHKVWPREETLSCCCVPSPAQSPILTTSATWTSSWSGFPHRPFFHWISGSKPQLNQVYGNNQILIYPKVFNPYWWFLFALFVQKCKWALNKGKGEGGRCHIIGVTSIQIFWSAFLITMIRVWHLSMYWLLIEEKYFRNE